VLLERVEAFHPCDRGGSHPMLSRPCWPILAALLLGLGVSFACGGNRAPAEPAKASLAGYSPEEAVLFDDVIAPAVFGFDAEGVNPATDVKLRERTRRADFIAAARVETVSRVGGIENRGAYEITLAPAAPSLVGEAGQAPIVLKITSTSPSYAWVDGAGPNWVGSRLLIFARRFREGGQTAIHFRCEPDTPDVRRAIERHAALRLLR
jgi:hypothetical protein